MPVPIISGCQTAERGIAVIIRLNLYRFAFRLEFKMQKTIKYVRIAEKVFFIVIAKLRKSCGNLKL